MDAKLPAIGQPRSRRYEGEGHVLLPHVETRVVREALQRLVSLVRVEVG
jgi:hypothetical protein